MVAAPRHVKWYFEKVGKTRRRGIERKVRNPTVIILERLAKALKVAPGRLLD